MTDLGQGSHVDEPGIYAVVERMLRRNGWRLLEAADLAARVSARRGAGGGGELSETEGAAIYCYAEALYLAFAGHEGEERQREAYHEMLRYLYRAAYRLAPELSADEREEIVYTVVAELYYRTAPGGVRVAGAFIAIALQQARNALRRWRGAAGRLLAEPELAEPDDEGGAGRHAGGPEDELYQGVARGERIEQIRGAFARALDAHPRARLQLLVVWLRAVEELDYQTIAERLEMSVANVRVLYSRGRSRLQSSVELRALADEDSLIAMPRPRVAAAQRARARGDEGRG